MLTCLLLPGMTLNATIFPDMPFPTFAVDFNDTPPPGDQPDQMTRYISELERQLETAEAWQAADSRLVVAHSFGGMLALRWLLAAGPGARRVDAMVLIGSTAGPMYDMVKIRLGRVGEREFRMGVKHLISLWNLPMVTKTVKRAMTGGSLKVEQVDFRKLTNPTDLRVDFAGWRNTSWEAMRAYRNAMDGYDVRDQLANISVPTIVLQGSEDALFGAEAGKSIVDRMPNAELRIVKGARHALPLTHGHVVRRAIEDLVTRVE